jgi:hypothetical protein
VIADQEQRERGFGESPRLTYAHTPWEERLARGASHGIVTVHVVDSTERNKAYCLNAPKASLNMAR